MRVIYDSVNPDCIPKLSPGDLVAGYDDGRWPNFKTDVSRFPGHRIIAITVFASDNEGNVLDVENGDATAEQAPGWVTHRRQAGANWLWVYTSESNLGAVRQAFKDQGVEEPYYWIAHYDGVPNISAAEIAERVVARQWRSDTRRNLDYSVLLDHVPGFDDGPAPDTDPVLEEIMAAYQSTDDYLQDQVIGWYAQHLHRAPDLQGLADWVNAAKSSGVAHAHLEFILSAEAQTQLRGEEKLANDAAATPA